MPTYELKCSECGNTDESLMEIDFRSQYLICVAPTNKISEKSGKKIPCFTIVKQLVDKIKYTR